VIAKAMAQKIAIFLAAIRFEEFAGLVCTAASRKRCGIETTISKPH
jgi:hypothetical protein